MMTLLMVSWVTAKLSGQEPQRFMDTFRIVFYNTENLYDPFNDTLTMDEDFLPGEPKAWGYKKFLIKINHLAKALILAGEWQKPGLIGLCEIENRFVLKKLVNDSPLKKSAYQILHYDSPDPRGVDVALLYDSSQFQLLAGKAVSMENPADPGFKTRDILYAKGLIFKTDTLHVFVNHWPSKFGGIASSLLKRKFVASRIKVKLDSILLSNPSANILLMGDFNDEAESEVLRDILMAEYNSPEDRTYPFINLTSLYKGNKGSHKFHGQWSVIDHFIVSKALQDGNIRYNPEEPIIVDHAVLLEPDDNYSGQKPYRTYSGPRYLGGFSDHLPIKIDLLRKN
ncbi:MAG: endonuclease/exonuclease/phosphatase family protein [Bacteroidales bacterium]